MSYLSSLRKNATEREIREDLLRFYEKYNPQRCPYVDAIMFAYRGYWEELFYELSAKYQCFFIEALPVKESSGAAMSDKASPAEALSNRTMSVRSLPSDALSDRGSPLEAQTTKSMSVRSLPADAVSDKPPPAEALSNRTMSVRSLPADTLSDRGSPLEALTNKGTSLGSLPVDPLSYRAPHVEALSDRAPPAEALTNRTMSVRSLPADAVSDRGSPLEAHATKSISVRSLPADAVSDRGSPLETHATKSMSVRSLPADTLSDRGSPLEALTGKGTSFGLVHENVLLGEGLPGSIASPLSTDFSDALCSADIACFTSFLGGGTCEEFALRDPGDVLRERRGTEGRALPFLSPLPRPAAAAAAFGAGGQRAEPFAPATPSRFSDPPLWPSLSWPSSALRAFRLTVAERLAERLLGGGPVLHYRRFLLICVPLERVATGRGVVSTEAKSMGRLPHWEPTLARHELWQLPPLEEQREMQTAYALCEAAGLADLWRDEVTFADVVAVRMRYFCRRYDFIKRVFLEPFTQMRRGGMRETLQFINAVEQISRFFWEHPESVHLNECIRTWHCEKELQRVVALLHDVDVDGGEYEVHTIKDSDPVHDVDCSSESSEQNERHPGGMLHVGCGESDLISADRGDVSMGSEVSAQLLMRCAALLSLHIDEPFRALTFVDIAATRHCLCTAAIAEKELYMRRGIVDEWKLEYAALRRHAVHATALVSLQQRERQVREDVEEEEYTQWLVAVREGTVTLAVLSTRWSVNRRTPSAANAQFPPPPVASQFPLSAASRLGTIHWRRENVQRRLAAFFEREAVRQRRSEDRRRIELVAGMLRAGRLDI